METKDDLIEKVLNQIKMDLVHGDADALSELLYHLPEFRLRAYLPEEYAEDDGQPDEAQEWHDFDPDC